MQGHEVRFLAHESWNGLLKESVEKGAVIASEKKKVKKQPGGASAQDPVLQEVERVCGLAEKMGGCVWSAELCA